MIKEPVCENAQKLKEQYPETFFAPSNTDLLLLDVNDTVKISVAKERFWCIIKEIHDDEVIAVVDNCLVHSSDHNLFYKDEIKFKKENIYSIYN